MSGVNKIILVGYCGKDPEVKHLDGGLTVAKFSLATTEVYKKDGEKTEETTWHNIVMWKGLAEIAEKYVKKGTLLYIEGKIRTRSYGEGESKKYFTEIVADSMQMLGGKKDGSPHEGGNTNGGVQSGTPGSDLPF